MKKELKGITEKTAIHCPTPEDYQLVLDFFCIDGLKREDMDKGWKVYTTNTCIAENGHCYGRIKFWQEEGYEIMLASDFLALNSSGEVHPEIGPMEALRLLLKESPVVEFTFKNQSDQKEFSRIWNLAKSVLENTNISSQPEQQEKNERKLLDGFRDYLKTRGVWSWTHEIDAFLASKRKPLFELKCQDGLVTDPAQRIFVLYQEIQVVPWVAANVVGDGIKDAWINKQNADAALAAAKSHLRQTSRQIALEDMEYQHGAYWLTDTKANELLNQRLRNEK